MLALFTVCAYSYAQDVSNELLKKLVEKNILTQNEADSLQIISQTEKEKNSFTQTVEKVRNAFNTPYMQFGGYGLLMYKYNDVSRIKHDVNARALYLHMRGELIENFSYFAMMEFVHPTLTEFYVDWTPSDAFNIKLGQAKISLSLENQFSATALESVTNSRSVSTLIGMGDDVLRLQNGKSNTGRDMGLQVYGNLFETKTHHLLEYRLGLFQGTGLVTSETNNTKDFAGNIMLQPLKGFRIGGGAYFGEATYVKDGETNKDDHVRNRWIASTDYKSDRFYARAEYIRGNDGGVKKEGLHGVGVWYFVPERLNAFARVDYLSANKEISREVIDYTAGVNYYFYKSCRFQLNYTYSDYSRKWDTSNSTLVQGQIQIVF